MPKGKANQSNRNFLIMAAIVVIGAGLAMFLVSRLDSQDTPEAMAKQQLAQCLTDRGFKFYGTYWCGHCSEQKKAFGKAFSSVDYVECAVRGNPQQQTPECAEAEIESYPTWVFGDDQRVSGRQELETLAELSGCEYDPSGATLEATGGPETAAAKPTIELIADGEDVTAEMLEVNTEPVE